MGHDEIELAEGWPRVPPDWGEQASLFASAFVAWDELTDLLTPALRTEARRVYPPGSPAISLGRLRPKPTVIEAVADELGIYFRNTVYQGRRHPLEPDTERIIGQAKAQATARQVAQGKPPEPFGWKTDYDELMKMETRNAVCERLGIRTVGDAEDLMMGEWKAQDRSHCEPILDLLRCGSIDFDGLDIQLIREAEAVLGALQARTNGGTGEVGANRKRPRRTDADKRTDALRIADHLNLHPDAKRDQVAKALGIAPAHVSASVSWRQHAQEREAASAQNRVRAVGGVGDPSVGRRGESDDD